MSIERLFDPNEQAGWLAIVGWRKFQHYHDRRPIWIKTYLDLLDRDEYLELTAGERSLLHGLWLMTASSRSAVRLSTRSLSRRLALKVTSQQLESLRDAGFIEFFSSKTDAELVQNRSAEVDRELEIEERPLSTKDPPSENGASSNVEADLTNFQPPELRSIP